MIELKAADFQCFRDEVTLRLIPAGRDSTLGGNIRSGDRHRALKSAAIFGSDASGRTSLLHALSVLRNPVVRSAAAMTVSDPSEGVDPFCLSPTSRKKPSGFEVWVELEGHGCRYRVEATGERVFQERLSLRAA